MSKVREPSAFGLIFEKPPSLYFVTRLGTRQSVALTCHHNMLTSPPYPDYKTYRINVGSISIRRRLNGSISNRHQRLEHNTRTLTLPGIYPSGKISRFILTPYSTSTIVDAKHQYWKALPYLIVWIVNCNVLNGCIDYALSSFI